MRSSVSKIIEVFYRPDGEPVEVYPRFCIDDELITSAGAPCLTSGVTLGEQMKRKPDSSICFYRTFALGDILLLTPIFNWLKQEYPACQIWLATATQFLGLFRYWDVVRTVDKRNVLGVDYDVGYYLDGIVEKDHTGKVASYKHRLDLYCEFLGIPVPVDPIFSLPYSDTERVWAETVTSALRDVGKPVVIMQVFGSTKVKRLPFGKVMSIAARLTDTCSLIFVHDVKESVAMTGTVDMTGATSIHELTALIDCSDVVITMDSGVLWIAHCTATPVIALLGPTREHERLLYHKNFSVVNLAEMIGCEPCFETLKTCKGAITCMTNVDEEEIARRISSGIRKVVFS